MSTASQVPHPAAARFGAAITAALEARRTARAIPGVFAIILGLVGAAASRAGAPPIAIVAGLAVVALGAWLVARSRRIETDPAYRALLQPADIVGLRRVQTTVTALGAGIATRGSVVIARRSGRELWLPSPGSSFDALVAELRALCPHVRWT